MSKQQSEAISKVRDAAATLLLPLPLARQIMDAIALAIPFDGYRFFQIDPGTLLISRLLDASDNDLDPRNEWLRDVYLRSGRLSYIELPEQMRSGLTSVALHDRQETSLGLKRSMTHAISPKEHYELFHELRSPTGGTIFGTFQANGVWVAALQAYRRDGLPGFRASDVEFLRRTAGTIGEAMAASFGRERAISPTNDPPGATGLLLMDRHEHLRPLTPTSTQWLDLLRDRGSRELSSAVLAARAALRSDGAAVARHVIAPTAAGPVRIEASRADAEGSIAIGISPVRIPDSIQLPADWPLTLRERAIALDLILGKDVGCIAAEQFISPTTVNWHLSNIYEKLGAKGRSGLVARFFSEVIFPGVAPFESNDSR
jgi:DNA-binding CsgD family transcriptional regulator